MEVLSTSMWSGYWSPTAMEANMAVFLNLLGAMLLGFVVGYERSYHGRAAGMRTYGLVCMASAALVVIAGYPDSWYGGHADSMIAADPTRIIQGIVTGIGFLGAGVIMKDGLNISGLTTAASLWASSAIGVMVGVGLYEAAILLTVLSASCMILVSRVEGWLPSRPAVAVTMQFKPGFEPREDVLRRVARERGYDIASGSFTISFSDGRIEWRFVAIALSRKLGSSLPQIAEELNRFEGVENFHLSHARN